MVLFQSLIVMDLETTSLPQLDCNTTKITELAFLGCEIEHLKSSKYLPRVLHKLVLLFNPCKTISPTSTELTGLANELLMNLKPFREEDVEVLQQFINRLPSPVCLVAHNGDIFDFPILRRAIVKVNKELQDKVYCIDSIKAFRTLLPKVERPMWTRRSDLGFHSPLSTPPNKPESNNALQPKSVCRELFPEDEAFSKWASSQYFLEGDSSKIFWSNRQLRSLKLGDIYKFYFGSPPAFSHRAEGDCLILLNCISQCQGFLEWMNDNAVIFNSVEPLF